MLASNGVCFVAQFVYAQTMMLANEQDGGELAEGASGNMVNIYNRNHRAIKR